MTGLFRYAPLQLRTARRLWLSGPFAPWRALGRIDGRMVFVVGSPRSGTTFLADSLGTLPGFVDLGEVAALKAAIPELASLDSREGSLRVRRILVATQRLGLTAGLRAIEQTPESAFVLPAIREAFPDAEILHIVRDGRDVVCSLLQRGWLSAAREGLDDAGLRYGSHARFWVEADRTQDFEAAGDARRAAWAWRRYVEAALAFETAYEVRYERLTADHEALARELAELLRVSPEAVSSAIANAHARSVGRFRRDLSEEDLEEIEVEAGPLLRKLGYE